MKREMRDLQAQLAKAEQEARMAIYEGRVYNCMSIVDLNWYGSGGRSRECDWVLSRNRRVESDCEHGSHRYCVPNGY